MCGQIEAQNGLATTGQPQFNMNSSAVSSSPLTLDQTVSNTPQNMSWKDPQIYLSSAGNGKSASVHYDIVDFIDGGMEEEIIVGGAGSHFGDHLHSKEIIYCILFCKLICITIIIVIS